MPYIGHVENGAIVFDEPTDLKDGDKVQVVLVEKSVSARESMPLRGTTYVYTAPFSPAAPDSDWASSE